MKKLSLLFAFFLVAGLATAQTEETKEVEVAKAELPEAAAKGAEISELAKSTELVGKEKGKAISSAARRSSMPNERAASGRANSAKGMEAAEAGKARSSQMRPATPASSARPNVTVPGARPNAPVVRPNTPAPNRPVTPPGGRPGGL